MADEVADSGYAAEFFSKLSEPKFLKSWFEEEETSVDDSNYSYIFDKPTFNRLSKFIENKIYFAIRKNRSTSVYLFKGTDQIPANFYNNYYLKNKYSGKTFNQISGINLTTAMENIQRILHSSFNINITGSLSSGFNASWSYS